MKCLSTLAISVSFWLIALPVFAQMGPPPIPMSPTQFSEAAIGQNVQIAVRVQRVERSTLYAELLARETDTLSKATGKQVVLFFPDGTPVIMGTASDVVPGAVLYVYGVVTKAGHVDAKRVVVDTKYVKVQ
jgi:hypothetical protein